jgi:hypothetical protein
MAKLVKFIGEALTFEAELVKLDRDKVYGYVVEKNYDSTNQLCQTAYLLEDGMTVIPAGGFSLKSLVNGHEIAKKDLIAVDQELNPLPLIPSIFDKEVTLSTHLGLNDYLCMNVNAVYQLFIEDGKQTLLDYLNKGNFLSFDFNFRAGYETAKAFLIANGENLFAVVGNLVEFEYLSLKQAETLTPDLIDSDEEEGDLDFGML